jgi:hypothetical protein
MTFKRQNNVSVVEVGILSLGNAIGANLQIGGPGRGELAFFHFLSNRGWFSRQSAAGAMQVGVGFNANPKDFVSGWTGWYFNEPLSISGADFVIASSPTGTAPNKTIGGTYFSVTTANGRAHFENAGNQGFYITGTDDQINVFQRSNDLNMLRILRVQAWSDSLVIANSFALNLGDLNNAHRAMFVASAGHGVMTRFGISSTYTLITSAQAASSDFLAPEGATSVLRVHNAASGLNSAVIMRLSTAKAVGVQAGDMFNVLTSTGYITTSITPDGILASTTADVFWEDDNIAFEDENVYYSAIH